MAALRVGVIIGRFQVPELHDGHRWLFTEVAAASDRIVVLLGVSPVDGYTAENPLTFAQRQAMIQSHGADAFGGIRTETVVILPLFDQRTNEEWSAQLDRLLKGTYPNDDVTLYGGRASFIDSYIGTLPVVQSSICPLIPTTGAQVRQAVKEANSAAFYAGQIYALQRQFPRAFPTVDVALVKDDLVLLIQRADSGHWCFPGGFVDPTDESFELAAQRELQEEVGLHSEAALEYICTKRVNDFRYRGSRDKILTTFFLGNYFAGPVMPNPTEVQDYKWVKVNSEDALIISDVHKPLLGALRNHPRFALPVLANSMPLIVRSY
jgi:bifunctional NMN adenylyltransferase/nudix hydrolase